MSFEIEWLETRMREDGMEIFQRWITRGVDFYRTLQRSGESHGFRRPN